MLNKGLFLACALALVGCSSGGPAAPQTSQAPTTLTVVTHDSFTLSDQVKATFQAVILQIIIIDLVFSLDSIITAVGMVDEVEVMIAAVIASVGMMVVFASHIGRFVSAHPTIKMLALSFLIIVGLALLLEGFGGHIPKGYIYFAMAFSVIVEMLNIRMRKKVAPVHLHEPYVAEKK